MDNSEQMGLVKVLNDTLDVDNTVQNYTTATVVKQKQKILTIDVDEEWIENNIIDLPFIYYYQAKEPIHMVEYKWRSNDGLDRAIQVRSSIHGVPSPFEFDVLAALLRIHVRNHNNKIIINGNMDNTISFTFRELAQEMGFKGFGGKTKERLDKAIERLCDTNIYNTSKGGLYNPVTKEYITDAKMSINILYDYKTYSYKNTTEGVVLDRSSIKDKASVVIGEFFYNSIKAGKGKISNKQLRLSLKVDLARRIYLITNKWRNNRTEFYITYNKLYERIPLIDSKSISYRNKRIKTACEELVEKGYLQGFECVNEGIMFKFNCEKSSSSDTTPIEDNLKSRYRTFSEINEGLMKYGFSKEEIDQYLSPDDIKLIQAILRYVDVHSNIENPKYYIIGSLIKRDKKILENPKYADI